MKIQTILETYKNGAITLDEALYLLSKTKDASTDGKDKQKKLYAEVKSSIIEDIIEDTDFYDIKKAMDDRDWSYSYSNGQVTIEELTKLASKLLGEAIDTVLSKVTTKRLGEAMYTILDQKEDSDEELYWGVSTGGFRAEAWYNDEEDMIEARLSFVLCETEAGVDLSAFI